MSSDKIAVVREFLLEFGVMAVKYWNTGVRLLDLVEREITGAIT